MARITFQHDDKTIDPCFKIYNNNLDYLMNKEMRIAPLIPDIKIRDGHVILNEMNGYSEGLIKIWMP